MRLLATFLLLAAIYLHLGGGESKLHTRPNGHKHGEEMVGSIRAGLMVSTGLMLYQCNSKAIKMLVPVAVGAGEQCLDGEPIVNIIERDRQCVYVKDEQYNNGNPIILCACENVKGNQLWTFKSNGTIRLNGKCLTTYGYASGNYLMIFDYDTAVPEATKWILYNAGTIMNPRSGLFIAAETFTQGTVLTVAKDNNSFRLAWSAGNYTQPTINYISGFLKILFNHNACVAAAVVAMNSDSHDDSATVACFVYSS
nr:type 2 ribosome-inactivating protein precursor [Tanacetum cinerariifolium]